MTFKMQQLLLALAMIGLLVSTTDMAQAQCAMCSLNAENSTLGGNSQGKGLNDGILFLLAIPYLIAVGIGILWYTKYRKNQGPKVSPFKN